jgi:hypothetical protein
LPLSCPPAKAKALRHLKQRPAFAVRHYPSKAKPYVFPPF